MQNKKIIYGVVIGLMLPIGVGAWLVSSSLVNNKFNTTNRTEKVNKIPKKTEEKSYETLDLLTKSDKLKSYEARQEDYKKSIKAFHKYYNLSEPTLSGIRIYSATSRFVVVSVSNGDTMYLLNPNGSIVGYFSKDFLDSSADTYKGFKLVKDGSTGLVGVFSDNFAQNIQYQELPKEQTSESYKLADYPINKDFVVNLSSYSPREDITFELGDSRYSSHYRVYSASENDLILVDKDGMIVGALPTDAWKDEVFRRAGTGTLIEVRGVNLWVY